MKAKHCQNCNRSFSPTMSGQKWCTVCLPDKPARWRWEKYGLSDPAFTQQLTAQDYRCAICQSALTRETAVVDHKHGCCPSKHACDACRRGLLCTRCNVGLHYVEQPGWLDQAALYLQRRS